MGIGGVGNRRFSADSVDMVKNDEGRSGADRLTERVYGYFVR